MMGKFITFEGIEGAGKSTVIQCVQDYLSNCHIPYVSTREPGGTTISEQIRSVVLDKKNDSLSKKTELLLMFAARAQHVDEVIRPALLAGKWVVCDRFTDATYAYQGGGRELDNQLLDFLANMVHGEINPDLTILMDVDVKLGLERAGKRSVPDRFESQDLAFFENVRSTYLNRAHEETERFKVVDASQSLDTVKEQILAIIESLRAIKA